MARITNVNNLRLKLKEFINEHLAYINSSAQELSAIVNKWTKVQRQKFHS
jgi:hypothetical protein